jgi:hypothetical protein
MGCGKLAVSGLRHFVPEVDVFETLKEIVFQS